jgi:hypothetical protein
MRELFMAMLAGGREYGYGIKQALEAEFRATTGANVCTS